MTVLIKIRDGVSFDCLNDDLVDPADEDDADAAATADAGI